MADDKDGREKQARNAERRQRRRELQEELERADETEPPVDGAELDDFESGLAALSFPVTGTEVVAAVGHHDVHAQGEAYAVRDLVPETDDEAFDTPATLRDRVARPTVAAAMKRVVEASVTLDDSELPWSQREAYERTFRALVAVDLDDWDEAVRVMADWIVERIEQKGRFPGSRDVRRQAAIVVRSEGHSVRNDEWLGV